MAKFKSIVNNKYGKLTVIRRVDSEDKRQSYWLCKCDCGNEITVNKSSLTTGNTRSCGCLRKEMSFYDDISGNVFERLTVLYKVENGWMCRCNCGNEKVISANSLKTGGTRSCGCLHKDSCKQRILPDAGAAKNKLYHQYKRKAIQKGFEFRLEKEEFLLLTSENCHYCGAIPTAKFFSKGKNLLPYIYNGIDRLDSSKGYYKENCVSCCKLCNYAKRTMLYNEFKDWVIKVYQYLCKLQ